jgi:hypothetical protein
MNQLRRSRRRCRKQLTGHCQYLLRRLERPRNVLNLAIVPSEDSVFATRYANLIFFLYNATGCRPDRRHYQGIGAF